MWSPWRMTYISAEHKGGHDGPRCVFCDLPARQRRRPHLHPVPWRPRVRDHEPVPVQQRASDDGPLRARGLAGGPRRGDAGRAHDPRPALAGGRAGADAPPGVQRRHQPGPGRRRRGSPTTSTCTSSPAGWATRNFMPVMGDVRVMPQHLDETYALLPTRVRRVTIDPRVFKAYDVRGLYPQELDEEGAERIGAAFIAVTGAKRVAVGHDTRLSSPSVAAAFTEGALVGGRRRDRARPLRHRDALLRRRRRRARRGRLHHREPQPAPVHRREDGHRRRAAALGRQRYRRGRAASAMAGPPRAATPGTRSPESGLLERFVDRSAWASSTRRRSRGLKVVIDSANGMSGLYMPPVLERLDIDAVPYFLELDGTFPNHEPNPLLPENREFIMRKVLEHGADLGIAFDGDADRCFFIDDAGEFVDRRLPDRPPRPPHPGPHRPGDGRLRPARLARRARRRSPRRAARRTCSGWATPSSSAACARSTPSSPAR